MLPQGWNPDTLREVPFAERARTFSPNNVRVSNSQDNISNLAVSKGPPCNCTATLHSPARSTKWLKISHPEQTEDFILFF